MLIPAFIDFDQSGRRKNLFWLSLEFQCFFGAFASMLSPPIIGLIAFAIILAGAFGGWAARQLLPEHHLSDETKSLVTVSMAVVGTISALVLGLLISNANTSFITRSGEVTALSADILRLDPHI